MVLLARPVRRLASFRPTLFSHQHGSRPYSVHAITSAESIDISSYVALFPASAMELLHGVGLPWFAVLPLSAVLVRSLVQYPLFQRPLRKKLVDRAHIQPLVDASLSRERRQTFRGKYCSKVWLVFVAMAERAALQANLFRRLPFPYRFFSFMTTIIMSDALRRLSGAKEGLLKFILGPLDWTVNWMFEIPAKVAQWNADQVAREDAFLKKWLGEGWGTRSRSTAPTTPDPSSPMTTGRAIETPAESTVASVTDSPTQDVASSVSDAISETSVEQAATSVAGGVNSPWFEPTLTTEGFSWCSDLTASDPSLILPIIFSSSFFASIYFAPRVQGAATALNNKRAAPTNLQRIGMTVAALSFIPALQMPAGLLLYFITNLLTNNLMGRWLAYRYPIRPAPTACKRPIRMQPSKELPDDLGVGQPKR